MNVNAISARVSEIAALGLSELTKRQPMLVELIADIVNHETENGYLTMKAGNLPLTMMPYWNSLMIYLNDAGFEVLGNGHFSAAFKHRLLPQKVIKVGFKKEDSGAAYAAFCRMNQGKQGIPTIHDIQRHAGCYTVVLDELRNIQTDVWGDVADNHWVDEQYDCARQVIQYGLCPSSYEGFDTGELAKTCAEIRKFFVGIASFDMHTGNAMVDKDGNLVITDPVSFTSVLSEDEFHVDPEELLAEIEQIAERKRIERCRERKAKRDPNGTFRFNLKQRQKRRKECKKAERLWKQDAAKRALQAHNRDVAFKELGRTLWMKAYFDLPNAKMVEMEAQVAAKVANRNHKAIALGQALDIDKELDAMFQG